MALDYDKAYLMAQYALSYLTLVKKVIDTFMQHKRHLIAAEDVVKHHGGYYPVKEDLTKNAAYSELWELWELGPTIQRALQKTIRFFEIFVESVEHNSICSKELRKMFKS